MDELVSISEAAEAMGRDPSRVRALAAAGLIPAVKIGGRWAVERSALSQEARQPRQPGRPFEPRNAWALLRLASGEEAAWLTPAERWRLRRALRVDGLAGLRGRLGARAHVRSLHAHPGELSHLLGDRAFARTGISAARDLGLDLVSASEADGYVSEGELKRFVKRHALKPASFGEGNVVLRVVPADVWALDDEQVPEAAVALDLAEARDARSRRAGERVLRRLDTAARGQ